MTLIKMRKLHLTVICFFLIIGGYPIWNASVPKILSSYEGHGAAVTDYSGDENLHLGGFTSSRVYVRRWFDDSPAIYTAGMIFEGIEGKETSIGGARLSGGGGASSTEWFATIGPHLNPDVTITLRFNFDSGSVTLLNTGEVLNYTADKVFTVFVDENLKITRFDALDPDGPLPKMSVALLENFYGIWQRRQEW